MARSLGFGSIAVAVFVSAACNKGASSPQPSSVQPTPMPAPHGQTQPIANAPAPQPAAEPAAPAPSGPRATMNGEHYTLTANLGSPPSVPGDASLTVEVHGGTGYHVNELYPVALDLTPSNATAPAHLHRADIAELSQQVARFNVPVHVTATGAVVRGTLRFAVCSESNCVPQQQAFAVALQ